jgi:excisionase family DNA binding protein
LKNSIAIAGPGDLLLTSEVAEGWRVNVETVRRAIREKRIRAIKVGRHWRIRRKELDRIESEGGM